jgi:hypothetical protein
MDLSNLKAGERYSFHIKDFQPPIGDVIPGKILERTFIRMKSVGANGLLDVPFVEVERQNGERHLIAVEAIGNIVPAFEVAGHK